MSTSGNQLVALGESSVIVHMMAALALAADAPSSAATTTIPVDLQARFDEFLKDPRSAQIEIISHKSALIGDSSDHVICGRYNAKNSYGGYTGFKAFVFTSSNDTFYSDGTVVRPGSIDSLEKIMANDPHTQAELDALRAKAEAIIAEVKSAFRLCVS